MGGRAFLQDLPPGSLPRLPTPLYVALKARLTALLLTIYGVVEVPSEKPEKKDHGDIDFVVARPLSGVDITPDRVGHLLGAVKSIELDGNRTSNYAISISQDDWLTHSAQPVPLDQLYCQVDVRVCEDEEEAERIIVFHGFGDLGIIISAIAKSYGLLVNHHGLKVTCPHPNPAMLLAGSPRVIFDFMGLSMDRWTQGFETVQETFQFAATSRFFHPHRLRVQTHNKTVQGRSMYMDFLMWAHDRVPTMSAPESDRDAVEDALMIFGRKSEWDAMNQEKSIRDWLKTNFNGKLVAEWTGLGWKGVKAVMDDVRSSVGGERSLVGMELEQVKKLVLISQQSLKLE